ncbi:hypothetical protein C4D60_Mb04t32570 [Musa balbisiana]|uniref:Uncharacterized protein n=1 Tax=Musa balbisiana TaxID=52838 RepID=A0A4S8KG96_MUSBA|nr:hypothetical protein C4D60_Mb04t32570 [Musa balbisiana]
MDGRIAYWFGLLVVGGFLGVFALVVGVLVLLGVAAVVLGLLGRVLGGDEVDLLLGLDLQKLLQLPWVHLAHHLQLVVRRVHADPFHPCGTRSVRPLTSLRTLRAQPSQCMSSFTSRGVGPSSFFFSPPPPFSFFSSSPFFFFSCH